MRTAEETRKLIDALTDEQAQKQLQEIEAQIDSAIFDTKEIRKPIYIYYYDRLTDATKSILNRNGYKVKESDNQHDGYSAKISWETFNEK